MKEWLNKFAKNTQSPEKRPGVTSILKPIHPLPSGKWTGNGPCPEALACFITKIKKLIIPCAGKG